jgi:hypothetical protein
MPLSANQTPVSVSDLKNILSANKINQGDIQSSINSLALPTTKASLENPTTTTAPAGFISELENMFKGLQTGTTQAQAIITTQAQLPDNAPIPPAFLTKLYNLKKGSDSKHYDNSSNSINSLTPSDVNSDGSAASNYNSSTAGSYSSRYDNQNLPNYMHPNAPNNSNNSDNSDGYLIFGIPHTQLTNPQTTYAAFSGRPIITKPNGPAGNPTYPGGRIMTDSAVEMEKKFKLLAQTYNRRPIYTNPSTTSISHFSNMNNINNNNTVQEKIKNNNKDIENIALGFVTVIILLFLLVIFNTIRNSKTNSITK